MKFVTLFAGLVFSLGLFSSAQVLAESASASGELMEKCHSPQQPTIPNGLRASKDEMITAQKSMKAYLADGDGYIECLQELERSWGDTATDEQKAVIVLFHNKMIDDMESVAELFNAAVRAYKGKKQ